jgi:CheY-like chemotaxis protein
MVDVVDNGKKALDACAAKYYDLVLMDIMVTPSMCHTKK